jgi:hypothetical protein
MGNQKTSGLTKRGGIWHIDKQFRGVRIRESAATSDLTEAIALLAKRGDSKGAGLRSSARADFSSGGDEVSAGESTEEKHRR